VTLGPGERLVSYSTSGGGYGSPSEREPARVARDLRAGWISREVAQSVYKTVIDATGALDAEATNRLRRDVANGQ
jgi:N-methylhydantoinase B